VEAAIEDTNVSIRDFAGQKYVKVSGNGDGMEGRKLDPPQTRMRTADRVGEGSM
jgi:hypothetical protein